MWVRTTTCSARGWAPMLAPMLLLSEDEALCVQLGYTYQATTVPCCAHCAQLLLHDALVCVVSVMEDQDGVRRAF